VQHAAAVAQARDAPAVEQVRVDARHLRRDVGAHAHHLPRQLVHQLEGAQVEIVPVPVSSESVNSTSGGITSWYLMLEEQVQDQAAQRFDPHRLRGRMSSMFSGSSQAHDCFLDS
jgi:hypothetical protein